MARVKDAKKAKALEGLWPGKEVNIPGTDVTIIVEPLGVRHVKQFSAAISKVMPTIVGILGDEASDEKQWVSKITTTLLPFMFGDLIDMLNDCCDVDITTLPHEALAPVAESWIEQSFGDEGKLKPWKDLFLKVMKTFLKQDQGTTTPSTTASTNS